MDQVVAGLRAQNERAGAENAGDGARGRNDVHGETAVINWITSARIKDVTVAAAMVNEMSEVIARAGHGMIGDCHATPAGAGIIRVLQSDVPRRTAGRFAEHPDILAKINEHVLNAVLLGH
jgi:hypothetical protein